jgi:predicted  nucleic acid-binding Zn-ribbon protein
VRFVRGRGHAWLLFVAGSAHQQAQMTTGYMSRFSALWDLQEIDSALDTRRATLADAEARLIEPEEISQTAVRADGLAAAARAATAAEKDIELEADDLKTKIAAADGKLYGGTIKNPKELKDLQSDIEQLRRQLSSVEDRALEALSASEAAQREAAEAATQLAAMKESWAAEQTELRQRVEVATGEIARYEAARAEQMEYIEPDIIKVYDHVRRVRNGTGVARLDRNLCLGCRISLPTNIVNRARAGNVLVQCPNCERILFP